MTLNICFQPSPSACRSLHVDFKCQRNKPAVLRATYSDVWKDLLLQCSFHECFAVKQINKSVKCDRLQNSIQFEIFFLKFPKRFKASLFPPVLFLTVSNFYTLWAHFQEFVTAACLFPPAGHRACLLSSLSLPKGNRKVQCNDKQTPSHGNWPHVTNPILTVFPVQLLCNIIGFCTFQMLKYKLQQTNELYFLVTICEKNK